MKAYEFFGLDATASKQDVQIRYMELKSQFSAERFEVGEAGERAAKNLDLLETYYKEIMAQFESQANREEYGTDYGAIEQVIKDGDIYKAQGMLDAVTDRTGDWHYLQSIIFYKNNWFLESKKQLEFALNLEPQNQKFIESYEKLTKIIASKQVRPEDLRTKEQSTTGKAAGTTGSASPCTGNCCCDLCLADACCECMGGDCIPCC